MHRFTDNYVKVSFPAEDRWMNHLVEMKLGNLREDGLVLAEAANAMSS